MKFQATIDINKPKKEVSALFADPQYLKEYQEGFIKKELQSGDEGQDHAVSKMYYKTGKREMELTETIVANRLPDTFEANYHHKHMDNSMKCSFVPISDTQTRYVMEVEYTAFRGLIPNLMSFFFPGIFKKQAEKWMHNFKLFVEKFDA